MLKRLSLAFLLAWVAALPATSWAQKGKIKIAVQAPLSGEQAALGEHIKLGAQLAVEESVKAFVEKIGEFDHLTTPGSEAVLGKFLDLEVAAAKKAFESKFWGQYRAAKYAAPKIREGGSITFFAGIWSQRPIFGAAPVAAINSAVEGLGRALAVELAPIRVNTVSPGIVDTPLYSGMEPGKRKAMFQGTSAK